MRLSQDTHAHVARTADEFSDTRKQVESYFDGSIEQVASRTPVSHRQLVGVLARAQVSASQLSSDELAKRGTVVAQSPDETLFWLDSGFWLEIQAIHHLAPEEVRAAQAVHRRTSGAMRGGTDCVGVDSVGTGTGVDSTVGSTQFPSEVETVETTGAVHTQNREHKREPFVRIARQYNPERYSW